MEWGPESEERGARWKPMLLWKERRAYAGQMPGMVVVDGTRNRAVRALFMHG